MRVLVVEDNHKLSSNLKTYLELEKCKVDLALDGEQALYLAGSNLYDVVILDLNLPKIDGLTVCRRLRSAGNNVPLLILTSRDTVSDKVTGLELGADDYLTKPFEYEELLARLKTLIRRESGPKNPLIKLGNLSINLNTKKVLRSGAPVGLSPTETALLLYLVQHRGKVISRQELLEKIWGDFNQHALSRTVDIYIGYLRKKLGPDLIETSKGFGYLIS